MLSIIGINGAILVIKQTTGIIMLYYLQNMCRLIVQETAIYLNKPISRNKDGNVVLKMFRKQSSIDFNYFSGQSVIEVNTEKNLPLGLGFSNGGLIIECPWRLLVANQVLIGFSDCTQAPDKFTHKNLESILMGKKVMNIYHFEEISDLVLEFEDNTFLELFHDSSFFEGWQLRGDNGFYLFTLPGGSYSD
ncbi:MULTISPECIES: hypothetical protein [Sporosarcina]|uniref:hypothetical protein n=1 Tax=Sporosarcina TaxID=1569 RepID=UPI001E5F6949|nr:MULTISPECIES: hypothetical protein [Sporosarcina]